MDPSYINIFEYYDKNGDNNLDTTELAILKKDINEANSDKVKQNLSEKETKKILNKISPDKKIKTDALNNFLNTLQKNYETTIETVSDGIIDNFKQGVQGNCWLLSSLKSLSKTEWGAKAIKDSISEDKEAKNYTVKLQGVDFECIITYDEIEKERQNPKRPKGDIDVLLLDIATEKYFIQEVEAGRMPMPESSDKDKPMQDLLNGGFGFGDKSMQYLLTGKKGHEFTFYSEEQTANEQNDMQSRIVNNKRIFEYNKRHIDLFTNIYGVEAKTKFLQELAGRIKNCSVVCEWKDPQFWGNKGNYTKKDVKNRFDNDFGHEFILKDIITDDNGNIVDVVIENPWNTEILIHKSLQEIVDQLLGVCITDENENYEDFTKLGESCWMEFE